MYPVCNFELPLKPLQEIEFYQGCSYNNIFVFSLAWERKRQ